MSRINTNVSSLIAQRVLTKNNTSLSKSLERLSTGLRINTGADDPAGLIASENLRSEKVGINTAISNAERAGNIIGTAEGGLGEVSSLLNELQSLVGQAANSGGLSDEEVAANQLQVDSILNTINRIANATSFQGKKLLNGELSYTNSGVTTSAFDSLQVNAARLPDGKAVNVVVKVLASATQGKVTRTGATLSAAVTFTVAGNLGTEQLAFASGTAIAAIASGINALTDVTGVKAAVSGTALNFLSGDYGTSQFVSVTSTGGSIAITGGTNGRDDGSDASVTVNGQAADTDGRKAVYRNANLDLEFEVSTGMNTNKTKTFAVKAGGAEFALGTKVSESGKAVIGIAAVNTGALGDGTLGFLSDLGSGKGKSLDSGELVGAQRILEKSIKQVSTLRGRLGAFQKFTINSTVNSLGVALENASAAESAIRDTDFASETANLTRSQILSQAATTVLAQANASPQSALQLLQ